MRHTNQALENSLRELYESYARRKLSKEDYLMEKQKLDMLLAELREKVKAQEELLSSIQTESEQEKSAAIFTNGMAQRIFL